jgi:hypothetical protein
VGQHLVKLYQNKIYGSGYTDPEFSLIGADSKNHFEENLKTQPLDWEYRTKPVLYNRNSLGHRCKELEMLKDNFVLFIGCSLTEGVGVALEDTFTYKLAQDLGLDYYNLGLAGSGADLLCENLSKWFLNIKKIPKLVVIQWPAPNRYYQQFTDGLTPVGAWIAVRNGIVSDEVKRATKYDFVNEEVINNFVNASSAGYFEHFSTVLRTTTLNFLDCLGVKYVEFTDEDFPKLDVGRDLIHPGTESNSKLVSVIRSII